MPNQIINNKPGGSMPIKITLWKKGTLARKSDLSFQKLKVKSFSFNDTE
jgi:hypothetical protein